ncbi:sodium-dependent transporter [Candidatus Aerophobetes bacterium]|uniref:Sodium-dependent transporter n=1 Tax=Aerophobetes bacterium TaxID=2030807 RepID=A0A2A4YN68_UNCAE|nr:MAG: sodium-dependent transporter [Candidatus Aerophobetes bacterium]
MEKRITWKKESGLIWSLLGSAIGFGNILSFSAQCYKNGGGAFLIPFIVALIVLGVPMLFLEGVIGYRTKLPIVSAYGKVLGNTGRSLGWLMVAAVATIGGFYLVLTGYSVAYAYFSVKGCIPQDTATFFKHTFLSGTGSLTSFGGISWPILLVTFICGTFAYIVLLKGIRSGIERVCSIFMPIMLTLIVFFAIIVCYLPGASEGFIRYLVPDFSKIMNFALWRDVFGHVFFSFSLGLGIITAYSRHSSKKISIKKVMWYIALGDFLVSFLAGFVIFGAVGHLSYATGTPFSEIVQSDSTFEMGFVLFPKILHVFTPWVSSIVGCVFFISVFIAGITGFFSIAESFIGNLEVEFSQSRKKAVSIALAVMLGIAFMFCFGNGQALIEGLTPMLLGNNMIIGGLFEVVAFMYLSKEIRNDAIWFNKLKRTNNYHMVKNIVPPILFVILCSCMYLEFTEPFGAAGMLRWGWFSIALVTGCVLARKRKVFATAR